jgi:hypothetical protein
MDYGCKIQFLENGDRRCLSCGATEDREYDNAIDCPRHPKTSEPSDPEDKTNWLGGAAVIFALCIGLSTCKYVEHRIEQEKPAVVKTSP